MIPVLWLRFVCERGVGEVGHLVRDNEVLLCPFPLGNKSCLVKWTTSKSKYRLFLWTPESFQAYCMEEKSLLVVKRLLVVK